MEQENKQMNSLPDNAYRELAPGEEYKPMMPANTNPKEVTPYSVTFGIIMAVIFSAAAAYLGLKVGQVFEAAIPIAIMLESIREYVGEGQNFFTYKRNNMRRMLGTTVDCLEDQYIVTIPEAESLDVK